VTGSSWTTDAPYRKTAAVRTAAAAGITYVKKEAAALYTYASARHRSIVCLAHVTNTMAVDGDDKGGADNGVHDTLAVAGTAAAALLRPESSDP